MLLESSSFHDITDTGVSLSPFEMRLRPQDQTASLISIPNEIRDEIFQYVLVELLPWHSDWATLELFRRTFTNLQLISKRVNLNAVIFTELSIKAKTLYHKADLSLESVYENIPEARALITSEHYGNFWSDSKTRSTPRMCKNMTFFALGEIVVDVGAIYFTGRWSRRTSDFQKNFIRHVRRRVLRSVLPLPHRDCTQLTILFHLQPSGMYNGRFYDEAQHSPNAYVLDRLEYRRDRGWIELERSMTEHTHYGPLKSAAGGAMLTEIRCMRIVRASSNGFSVRDSAPANDIGQMRPVDREWTRRIRGHECACDLQPYWMLRWHLDRDRMMHGRLLKYVSEFEGHLCKRH